MEPKERLTLTGLEHESLEARFYPDNPESPTYGHLQALTAVANGRVIDDDVKAAILKSTIRHSDHMERTIDGWNKLVLLIPELAKDKTHIKLSFNIMEDAMILSYGSVFTDKEERRRLIRGAIELLNMSISFN